ncbi:D-2-hydroxyacid dehydrogenase [Pseudonocardia spinosispora]|uniref:D-2-hydroxyacid dehydrogenase n=1 Tax=Pseudonocardia spinosispora TaxID=103441 RepID=UPI000A038640|nr:D-2-hydroxyacid dehydrogenase [Pseudonocardia spinosispora]
MLHSSDLPPGLDERIATDGTTTVRYATADKLADSLPGADALLVWDFTIGDVVRDSWASVDALRWVHTASAGVDRLIFDEMRASDIMITNSRGVFDTAMAEYVLGLVLAYAKDLPRTLRQQDRGEWRHRETETIGDKTAVVVGGGPIGARTAELLRAVGMRVHLVGRRARPGVLAAEELTGLLGDTDYLVLAAPLTEQTRGMVNADLLGRLPGHARVINVGRGPLIVEKDLVAALEAGTVAGAALDVFETEPLPADSRLWTLPNVIVSPHMSGDVIGWRQSLVGLFADNLTRYRNGEPLRNVVDKNHGYVRDTSPQGAR